MAPRSSLCGLLSYTSVHVQEEEEERRTWRHVTKSSFHERSSLPRSVNIVVTRQSKSTNSRDELLFGIMSDEEKNDVESRRDDSIFSEQRTQPIDEPRSYFEARVLQLIR